MAALRRHDAKVAESGFDNDACAGDFVPLHGNAEPGIVRPPASDSNQQIGSALGIQQAIEVGDRLRDFLAAAALEALRIDDHDVTQILDAPVASNLTALAKQLARLN